MTELRFAIRRLGKAPSFTIAAALTVALAVGANGLIFSAVNALLLRPLPFREADRVVWIYGTKGAGSREQVTGDEAQNLARQSDNYESVAVIGDRAFLKVSGDRRERWNGLWVTPSLAAVLGVSPVLGRGISLDDARTGARVMMVSHERWMRDLGGDSSLVGQRIAFHDGHVFLLVGVLPPGLAFPIGRMPQSGNGSGFVTGVQDFWILGQEGDELPGGTAVARLRPGVTLMQASAGAEVVAAQLRPPGPAGRDDRSLEIVAMRDQALGLVRPGLRLAQGFALLILLLACANLGNLVLLRAHAREQELAVQAALGASARIIVGGIIAEVALIAALGGAVGLALAALGQQALRLVAAAEVPMLEQVSLDGRVVFFTVAITVLVVLLAASVPVAVMARGNLHATLLGGGRTHTTGRQHAAVRVGLVVSQVAVALLLSVGAALIATSFARLMTVDMGYDPRGVITADVEIFDHPNAAEFHRDLNRRLRALPGVEAVGLIHSTPLTGKWTFADAFVIVGRDDGRGIAPPVAGAFVAFDYFAAMGTPVMRGRSFTEPEAMAGNAPLLMINEATARRFFPGEDPLGQSVLLAGEPRRIIGVVKDMRDVRLDLPAEPQWFQPLFGAGTQLIVRVAGNAGDAMQMIRRELLAVDSRFVVNRIDTLDDVVASTLVDRRMAMRLLSSLALLALSMAAIGLYGVVSFNVVRRQREFGVRSALGAQRGALVAMVLRDGIGMALAGVAVGVVLSIALSGVLERLLFEVSPTEPAAIIAISGFLLIVAAAASLLPAWRAASVDPLQALRAD